MLLSFTRRGALPLGKVGERLQVHRTSVTNIVDKLEADGLVDARRRTSPTAARRSPRSPTPAARSPCARPTLLNADALRPRGARRRRAGAAHRAAAHAAPRGRRLLTAPNARRSGHQIRGSPSICHGHAREDLAHQPPTTYEEWEALRLPRARRAVHHGQRRARRAALHRGRPAGFAPRSTRPPGQYPVHARRPRVDVPQPAVDHAPVRRLRHRRGDQRALPLPARPGPDRPQHRVRPADAHGPRHRRPRCRSARSAGSASPSTRSTTWTSCSPASTSARSRVDDDQRAGRDHDAFYLAARRATAASTGRPAARHHPERHPQGVPRPERVRLPAEPTCAWSAT